jgi:hypothetical protein
MAAEWGKVFHSLYLSSKIKSVFASQPSIMKPGRRRASIHTRVSTLGDMAPLRAGIPEAQLLISIKYGRHVVK